MRGQRRARFHDGFLSFHLMDYPQHFLKREKNIMELKLNIYGKENGKKTVVKTYKAETYDIMFGTVEDLINTLNLDGLNTQDNVELVKVATNIVLNGMDVLKPLLKDIFEGLTDDELRNTKVTEIVTVLMETVKFSMAEIGKGVNSKN
jgi:hypothetical protein